MAIEKIARVFDSIGAAWTLIGGHAIAVRGFPRMTLDYDFLTGDHQVLKLDTWYELESHFATIDVRVGDSDDPLGGVVHIVFDDGSEADVIVAKQKWQQKVIERSERMSIAGLLIPVARASDLILLKLSAGGHLDLADVSGLLDSGNREQLVREVEEHLEDLDPDARDAWCRLMTLR